eukprot:6564699-Alexandrium_andersonii.AAC.1
MAASESHVHRYALYAHGQFPRASGGKLPGLSSPRCPAVPRRAGPNEGGICRWCTQHANRRHR